MDGNSDTAVQQRLQGIPIAALIAAPLQAAAEAQRQLARTTVEFMSEVGFTEVEGRQETRMLEFTVNRPAETSEGITVSSLTVQAPMLALVPIPSLAVEEVSVDFQMEVTAAESTKEDISEETSFTDLEMGPPEDIDDNGELREGQGAKDIRSASRGASSEQVAVTGRVASSASQTRDTNQTAKYQIHVLAKKQEPTEAMSRLLDILATCVAPTGMEPGKKDTSA